MAIKLADTTRPNNYVDAEHQGTFPVAYAEDVWFADGTRLSEKTFDGQSIQKEELPLASADELGNIYQYVGETGTYTNGRFYKCILNSSVYSWSEIKMVENPVVYSETVPDINAYETGSIVCYTGEDSGSFKKGHLYKKLGTETLAEWIDIGGASTDLQAHVDNNTVHLTTEDRDNLTNLLLNEHNHANKTILDGILQAQVDNWNEAFTDKHTHENKTVIDKFTESSDGKVLYNGEKILYSVPIGTILSYSATTPPVGFLVCDGSEVSKTTYADLFNIIGNTYGTATDTNKFKLPDLRDKFVQGANGNLGTSKAAGLPNITGETRYISESCVWAGESSGAFRGYYSNTSKEINNVALSGKNHAYYFSFDASKSNAIYGKSNTVQPPSICLTYIIKH